MALYFLHIFPTFRVKIPFSEAACTGQNEFIYSYSTYLCICVNKKQVPEITVKRFLFTQMYELRKERVRQVTAYFLTGLLLFSVCAIFMIALLAFFKFFCYWFHFSGWFFKYLRYSGALKWITIYLNFLALQMIWAYELII